MDDFARGELLWARRLLSGNEPIYPTMAICHILEMSLEAKTDVGDCFIEFWTLFDGVYIMMAWNNEADKLVPKVALDSEPKSRYWWPLNDEGKQMRIEAIDFLLTGRQGATYSRSTSI